MDKNQEIIVIKSFKDHYPDFPAGEIIKHESPDFIIQDGPKKKIGIELVQLLPPPEHHYSMAGIMKPKYAYEQLMMTILLKNKKRKLYNNPHFNKIWLLIHFDYLDGGDNFNLKNRIEKWSFTNSFDRVFIYNLFTCNTYEIIQD